jgi:hypothetical protein
MIPHATYRSVQIEAPPACAGARSHEQDRELMCSPREPGAASHLSLRQHKRSRCSKHAAASAICAKRARRRVPRTARREKINSRAHRRRWHLSRRLFLKRRADIWRVMFTTPLAGMSAGALQEPTWPAHASLRDLGESGTLRLLCSEKRRCLCAAPAR